MDVFEAMGTARAMRFFKPDPVPQELLDKVLWAATRASSPNNTQGWDFIVVTDAGVRKQLGDLFKPFADRVAAMPVPESAV
ncbi:MAG: nitroreductase family protein, partial [Actinomycetota bacterium]